MNKDFMKELFDLDSGKYFKTKSYKGSWFVLLSSKGIGKVAGKDICSFRGGNRLMDLV